MKLETVNESCADEKKRIQELQLSVEELTTQLHQKGYGCMHREQNALLFLSV